MVCGQGQIQALGDLEAYPVGVLFNKKIQNTFNRDLIQLKSLTEGHYCMGLEGSRSVFQMNNWDHLQSKMWGW